MKSSQERRKYTNEQNKFIISSVMENNYLDWSEFETIFNEKFSEDKPHRTSKQLKNHYFNSLDKSVNKSDLTIEDQQFIIDFVAQNGKKFKLISKILNRNENQIKNEFYRKICTNPSQQINDVGSKKFIQGIYGMTISHDKQFFQTFSNQSEI
jgi:hypothetical protein